jgi:hypothetical protein
MKPQSLLFLLAFAVAALPRVGATTDIVDLSFNFSGPPPAGTEPWLIFTAQDVAPSTVKFTLSTADLQSGEFVSDWFMNISPTLDPTKLSFTPVSIPAGVTSPTIGTGENKFKADGDGFYDVDFTFSTGKSSTEFNAGEQVVFDVSGITGLTANDFLFQSAPGGGTGVYYSAAHIQGVPPNGSNSSWVGAAVIPEPSSFAAMTGALALGLAAWRRGCRKT